LVENADDSTEYELSAGFGSCSSTLLRKVRNQHGSSALHRILSFCIADSLRPDKRGLKERACNICRHELFEHAATYSFFGQTSEPDGL